MSKFTENRVIKPAAEAIDFFLRGVGEVTSSGPHISDNIDIKRFMIFAVFALFPSLFAATYWYGFRVILVVLVSYVVGVCTEWAFAIVKKDEIHEGIFVTCMIYPLTLPPNLPLWMVAVGIAFGVFFGKEVFGGTGRNIFNPALVGRLFITIAFPSYMASTWTDPVQTQGNWFNMNLVDATTSATPLTFIKGGQDLPYEIWDLLVGAAPGSMGETFRLGIIIAGIWLIGTKVASWRIPTAYIATVLILSTIGYVLFPGQVAMPVYQLLTGGLLYGAFFMATDPVSSPFTNSGKIIYGIGLGLLTVLIRSFSGFTEGVMFSIILMNAFGPLIDSYIVDSKFKPIG